MSVQDQLADAINSHRFGDVAGILDTAELESRNPLVLEDWPHALHILGHIYNKNLEDARFVWKRLPAQAQQNEEVKAVWKLLQFLWQRQYPGVWQALQAFPWTQQVLPLIQAISEKTRSELTALLSHAYSTMRPSKFAALCGLTEQEAVAAATAAGWRWDEASGTFQVVKPVPVDASSDDKEALAALTQYMAHLEQ